MHGDYDETPFDEEELEDSEEFTDEDAPEKDLGESEDTY